MIKLVEIPQQNPMAFNDLVNIPAKYFVLAFGELENSGGLT